MRCGWSTRDRRRSRPHAIHPLTEVCLAVAILELIDLDDLILFKQLTLKPVGSLNSLKKK